MYSVTIEPDHGLMHIRVEGFWADDVLGPYSAELRRQVDALKRVGGCRCILVDMSDYPIQSQAIAQAHARIIEHGKTVLGARTAVVMTSSLSRLQAARVARLAGRDLFSDVNAARAWLLS